MKSWLILCFIFSTVILAAQSHQPVIEYAALSNFNWGLFKGKINPKHVEQMGANIAAVTVSALSYTTSVVNGKKATVRITAEFRPHESWTRYPKIKLPAVALDHEKRHFDITEIYARKIRQVVSTTKFSSAGFNEELDALFKEMAAQHRAEQARYDHETNHSIKPEEQKQWNAWIDSQLEALSEFSKAVVQVNLN
jgi:Bacterial protein of unknown function (DUF922)